MSTLWIESESSYIMQVSALKLDLIIYKKAALGENNNYEISL